jgi:hypothetical protein
MLVDAGAELNRKDTAWQATPVGWALYYVREHPHDEKAQRYVEIADYLRARGGRDE